MNRDVYDALADALRERDELRRSYEEKVREASEAWRQAHAHELTLGKIRDWTLEHGAALKPPGADTYGEGMRGAKRQVGELLNRG